MKIMKKLFVVSVFVMVFVSVVVNVNVELEKINFELFINDVMISINMVDVLLKNDVYIVVKK